MRVIDLCFLWICLPPLPVLILKAVMDSAESRNKNKQSYWFFFYAVNAGCVNYFKFVQALKAIFVELPRPIILPGGEISVQV